MNTESDILPRGFATCENIYFAVHSFIIIVIIIAVVFSIFGSISCISVLDFESQSTLFVQTVKIKDILFPFLKNISSLFLSFPNHIFFFSSLGK